MEGIIMMAVLFIISSILNGSKKKKEHQKPMPPFKNQTPKQNYELPKKPEKRKSLEDFASEVFQQLEEKTQPIEVQSASKQVNESIEKEIVAQHVAPKIRPVFDGNRSSNRGSTITSESSKSDMIKQNEIGSFVPTSRKALVQAIITTEILGPPKAKQR